MISGDGLNKKFEKLVKNEKKPTNLKKKKGQYSKLPKDELVWNLEERKISHLKSWSKPQIIKRLEEDDKAQVELSKEKDKSLHLIEKLTHEFLECEMVYKSSRNDITQFQKEINRLARVRDEMFEKMTKITSTLELLKE
jgi:hypothetical protein